MFEWAAKDAIGYANQIYAEIENCNERSMGEWLTFDEWNNWYQRFFAKPQRWTILHEYIKDTIIENQRYLCDKHFDEVVLFEIFSILKKYNINYSHISTFKYLEHYDAERGEIDFKSTTIDEETISDHLIKMKSIFYEQGIDRLTNEVFTILYTDRDLLAVIGLQISTYIQSHTKQDFPNYLASDGVMKRPSYWPAWLKKGLVFRDKEICQNCGKVVAPSFNPMIESYHIDHIIPLNCGGTNDATNLQLLCNSCNTSKGARHIIYRNTYEGVQYFV